MPAPLATIHPEAGLPETTSNRLPGAVSLLRRVVPAFLGTLLICYVVYGRVHIMFTRSENGWMLERAQSWSGIFAMFRSMWVHNYSGHYVPLFFLLEALYSRAFGISEAWWRLHQLVIVAILILALLTFFGQVARLLVREESERRWLKVALTAPLVFSPLLVEFVSWPFTSGQLLWATLTALSLTLISRAIAQGANGMVSLRELGWSLVCGYASLHAFGLGAATMAAWLAVWAVLCVDGWLAKAPGGYLRKLAWLGAAGLLLTGVHGSLMLFLPGFAPPTPLVKLTLGSYVAQTLGFASCLFWTSLRSVVGPNSWPYPRSDVVGADWGYGLGLFLVLGGCALVWFRSYRARPSPLGLSRVCWQVFSLVTFGAYVAMASLRIRHQGESWLGYLVGPRYLWPSALSLFGFFASGVSCVRFESRGVLKLTALLVAGTCVVSNAVYQKSVVPKLWPWLGTSQEQTWHQIGRMAGELQRAGLPLPDLPITEMVREFPTRLAGYDTLLCRLGAIPAGQTTRWVSGESISPTLWQHMKDASPTLVQLSANLFAAQEASERSTAIRLAEKTAVAGRMSEEEKSGAEVVSLVSEQALRDTTLDHVKDHPNLGVDITVDDVVKRSVWIDTPTSLTYHHITLGAHPVFRVLAAIHPAVYGQTYADGAVFQVDVQANGQIRRLKEVYINPIAHPELRGWLPMEVDLSSYAGRTVDLILSNGPGPANNDYADWCIWGDPRLVDKP